MYRCFLGPAPDYLATNCSASQTSANVDDCALLLSLSQSLVARSLLGTATVHCIDYCVSLFVYFKRKTFSLHAFAVFGFHTTINEIRSSSSSSSSSSSFFFASPFLLHPFPSLVPPHSLPFPSPARGLGERCKQTAEHTKKRQILIVHHHHHTKAI